MYTTEFSGLADSLIAFCFTTLYIACFQLFEMIFFCEGMISPRIAKLSSEASFVMKYAETPERGLKEASAHPAFHLEEQGSKSALFEMEKNPFQKLL